MVWGLVYLGFVRLTLACLLRYALGCDWVFGWLLFSLLRIGRLAALFCFGVVVTLVFVYRFVGFGRGYLVACVFWGEDCRSLDVVVVKFLVVWQLWVL